jgi:glutathionyl-hydroquinone reductase
VLTNGLWTGEADTVALLQPRHQTQIRPLWVNSAAPRLGRQPDYDRYSLKAAAQSTPWAKQTILIGLSNEETDYER